MDTRHLPCSWNTRFFTGNLVLPTAIAWLALSCAAAAQTVIWSDNFDTPANAGARTASGNFTQGGGTASSVWWYQSTNALNASVVSTPAATGNFSGSWMSVNFSGLNNTAVSPFSAVTLGVGDTLSVQFDFRYPTAPNASSRSPQFGFFYSGASNPAPTADSTSLPTVASGYSAAIEPNGDLLTAYKNNANANLWSDVTKGSTSVGTAYDGAFTENIRLTLTRSALDTVVMDVYLGGVLVPTLTYMDTTASNFTFNEFAIRARGTANIDNFIVTTSVPEPNAFMLLAGSAVVLGTFTRRKNRATPVSC